MLVSGEAGIGKTRLVEELAASAGESGMATAWGRCMEEDAAGFWPWIEVIRTLTTVDPEGAAPSFGSGAAEIAQIVPEIKELVPGIEAPPALEPEAAWVRLYDAITSFLVRLADRRPLLLVVDDLQWADVPSLRLLQFLAARR